MTRYVSTDYESPALTTELPARTAQRTGRPRAGGYDDGPEAEVHMSSMSILILVVSLVGVVAIGVFAFARSTQRSDVRKTSVDDPGLDHRKD